MRLNVEAVASQHGRRQFAEGAVVLEVDRLLVVSQTEAEESLAGLRTRSGAIEGGATAALSVRGDASVVDERLELKLEDTVGGDLKTAESYM